MSDVSASSSAPPAAAVSGPRAAASSSALGPSSSPMRRQVLWALLAVAALVLLTQETEVGSLLAGSPHSPFPFLQWTFSSSGSCGPGRTPSSVPVGNRRRPRNAHPPPVFGPGVTADDLLGSGEDKPKSYLFSPPDRSFPDRYIVVPTIKFGRLSNARMIMADMVGLGIILNRTVILPRLDACLTPAGWESRTGTSPTGNADSVWDLDALRAPGVMTDTSLDIERLCAIQEGDREYPLGPASTSVSGFYFGEGPSNGVKNIYGFAVPHVVALELPPPADPRRGPIRKEDALSAEPYRSFFSDGMRSDNMDFMHPVLAEALEMHDGARCLFLNEKFMGMNWARYRDVYYRVQASLLPNPSIRSLVRAFLARNRLLRATSGTFGDEEEDEGEETGYGIAVPFIGVHLRLGDFLEPKYRSFGALCNSQTHLILDKVNAVVEKLWAEQGGGGTRGGASTRDIPLLLATDGYDQPCAVELVKQYTAGPVIRLDEGNPYLPTSCRSAVFDQEVLGYSAAFLGDIRSSFSLAIHNIRTLQRGYAVDTTTWLASGTEKVRPA